MHNYKPIIKLLKNRIKNNKWHLNWHLKNYGYAHWSDTTDYGYQSELYGTHIKPKRMYDVYEQF